MDDLGRWMRRTLDQVAPPVDPHRVISGTTSLAPRQWPRAVAAAVVVGVLVGGGLWLFAGEPSAPVSGDTTTTSPATTVTVTTLAPMVSLRPTRVTCTTELPDFPCSNLVDGDLSTEWQAPDGGIGAIVIVEFDDPVSVVEIEFVNSADDSRFMRNARIRQFDLLPNETVSSRVTGVLADGNGAGQHFGVNVEGVSRLTISVTGAYPGQSDGGLPPFEELALAELTIIGFEGLLPTEGDPTTATTATLPVTAGRDELLTQLDDIVAAVHAAVSTIDEAWDSRRATLEDTRQALLGLAASIHPDFALLRADLEPLLTTEEVVATLAKFADLTYGVMFVVDGLLYPDDGTMRRTAVALFEEQVSALRTAIDQVRSGTLPQAPLCSAEGMSPILAPIGDLPAAVAEMRASIAAAAAACDLERLVELALPGDPFFFAIGMQGDPSGWWTGAENAGEEPFRLLVCLLELEPAATPQQEDGSHWYRWPTASEKPWSELSDSEKQQLRSCVGERTFLWAEIHGEYLGPRVGITNSGDWLFFVLGGD